MDSNNIEHFAFGPYAGTWPRGVKPPALPAALPAVVANVPTTVSISAPTVSTPAVPAAVAAESPAGSHTARAASTHSTGPASSRAGRSAPSRTVLSAVPSAGPPGPAVTALVAAVLSSAVVASPTAAMLKIPEGITVPKAPREKQVREPWTEDEKFDLLVSLIPHAQVDWDTAPLPPGRSLGSVKSMIRKLAREGRAKRPYDTEKEEEEGEEEGLLQPKTKKARKIIKEGEAAQAGQM